MLHNMLKMESLIMQPSQCGIEAAMWMSYGRPKLSIEVKSYNSDKLLQLSFNELYWKNFIPSGGYAYRLCKVGENGIAGVTEECFQMVISSSMGQKIGCFS